MFLVFSFIPSWDFENVSGVCFPWNWWTEGWVKILWENTSATMGKWRRLWFSLKKIGAMEEGLAMLPLKTQLGLLTPLIGNISFMVQRFVFFFLVLSALIVFMLLSWFWFLFLLLLVNFFFFFVFCFIFFFFFGGKVFCFIECIYMLLQSDFTGRCETSLVDR